MPESQQVQFFVTLSQYLNRLGKRMDAWLIVHGLSVTEFVVMYELEQAENNTLTRSKLAEHMGLTASGITRLLAPMEKNGLTLREKHPRDARMSLVKLSKTGHKVFQESLASFERGAEQASSALKPAQLQTIIRQLGTLGA